MFTKKFFASFANDDDYKNFIFSDEAIDPNISIVDNKIKFGIDMNTDFNTVKNEEFRFENCRFMYEDKNKQIIANFRPLKYNAVTAFNEYNIAPYNAKYIGFYYNGFRIGEIELGDLKQQFGERKYRVGLMSDIHYNDQTIDSDLGTYTVDGSEYEQDLPNALNFYQNKEDVKFICSAGDVSSNCITHVLNFRKMLDTYAPTTPFYSCYGNHDFASANDSVYDDYSEIGYNISGMDAAKVWNEILTPANSQYELHYQDPTTELGKSSYWFEVPIEGTDKSDIYLFLSVNYNNGGATANVQMDMLTPNIQPLIDYVGFMPEGYNFQFYTNETLIWLKSVLDQFIDKRIFIFTHQFFVHKAGSNNIDNNFYHYGGMGDRWRISEWQAYCLSGIQFEFLNKLNNEHKKTIWFTGHSHYKWDWQCFDPHININDNEYDIWRPYEEGVGEMHYLRKSDEPVGKSGFNVHLPSTSRPLKISYTYEVAPRDSEGAIMDIYEDYVDIRAVVFKQESDEYENRYYPLGTYRINIKAA